MSDLEWNGDILGTVNVLFFIRNTNRIAFRFGMNYAPMFEGMQQTDPTIDPTVLIVATLMMKKADEYNTRG